MKHRGTKKISRSDIGHNSTRTCDYCRARYSFVPMEIIEYDSSDTFLQRATPVLSRNEAFTGLLYGVADRVGRVADADPANDPPFLATVEDGNGVQLIAIMTPPHRLLLHAANDGADAVVLQALADHMRGTGLRPPGVLGPQPLPDAFAGIWCADPAQGVGQTVTPGLAMTVYELRQLSYRGSASGSYRHATLADRQLLEDWTETFFHQVHGRPPVGQEIGAVARRLPKGEYRIWEDGGEPVCFVAQARPTPTGMAINAVFTPQAWRGRGYATSCVAALCAEILAGGKSFCTLFADVDNPTANGIYQRIGFEPLGQFVELDFT